jgi:hypothetical protein
MDGEGYWALPTWMGGGVVDVTLAIDETTESKRQGLLQARFYRAVASNTSLLFTARAPFKVPCWHPTSIE